MKALLFRAQSLAQFKAENLEKHISFFFTFVREQLLIATKPLYNGGGVQALSGLGCGKATVLVNTEEVDYGVKVQFARTFSV